MIPYNPKDEQQIGRKRHIGNDVVVLIFVSGKTPFSPISIQSQFNNVFIVVQPVISQPPSSGRSSSGGSKPQVNKAQPFLSFNTAFIHGQTIYTQEIGYRLAVTVKSNIPEFGPDVPDPPFFDNLNGFREFLLTKRKPIVR